MKRAKRYIASKYKQFKTFLIKHTFEYEVEKENAHGNLLMVKKSLSSDEDISSSDEESKSKKNIRSSIKRKKRKLMYSILRLLPRCSIKSETRKEVVGRSLFIFASNNTLRLTIYEYSQNACFEYFILIVVIVQSIIISWDNPLASSNIKALVSQIDTAMTGIFILEMTIKIVATGFIFNGKRSYLLNKWNLLDFLIVVSSVLTIFGNEKFQIMKLLRLLKAIKPLRLISRNDGLKIALRTVLRATPSLLHLMMILFIFFILSAIFMLKLFKGTFHKCNRD